jgi:RNA polymerase sigma-70 factor, ECF subfamily
MDQDEAIVERVLAGDRNAFGLLIDRHRDAATRLAFRIVRVRADAEDVAQEALLHAFLGLSELRARDRFGAWLLGIVVNLARTRRRARREVPLDDVPGGRAVVGFQWTEAEPSPAARQEARELHDLVWRALGDLPPRYQEAVQLHYVEGLRVWEIAALVGLPSGTVKARLHRARGRLRHLLAATLGEAAVSAAREEDGMVEVVVHDVVVQTPRDGEARWLADVKDLKDYTLGWWRVVLLKERDGAHVLPIWMGAPDGDGIALRLDGLSTIRPMPITLMARVLSLAEIPVERIVVSALRNDIFHATLHLRIAGRPHEVDARPSDAIALALERGSPIFVAPEMLALPFVVTAGSEIAGLEEWARRKREAEHREPEVPAMVWRPFRELPRAENPHVIGAKPARAGGA